MKTTMEISDALLEQAREVARARGTTLRALVEAGLREILRQQPEVTPFRLRDASFDGNGLTPEFAEGGWEKMRDAIYEGHGA